jgi:hypothetical protein
MMDSKNVLNVDNWSGNTDELEKQLEVTKEKLRFSRTMKERQRLLILRAEVAADFKLVNELRSKAYEIAIGNQSRIKSLNDEAEKLRLESVDITVEVWHLENNLKIKRSEMWQLEKAIADAKISG